MVRGVRPLARQRRVRGVRPSVRQRRVRAGRRASLRRSTGYRRLPCGARSTGPWPNSLRSLRSLRSNMRRQVSARSALRARAGSPPLLSASEAPSALPARAFADAALVFAGKTIDVCTRNLSGVRRLAQHRPWLSRQAVPDRGDFWGFARTQTVLRTVCAWRRPGPPGPGGEEHSPKVGARSALQHLTRRRLFERSERSERSEFDGATSGRAPQRSRRTRRPPQHEPLSGTACRDALNLRTGVGNRTATVERRLDRAAPGPNTGSPKAPT